MNDELQRHLDSLARDDCYRVDTLLKDGELERTECVYFVGANGSEQGPYVRKFFDCESGLGGAYRRILEAQRAGERFLHLPRIIDCYCVGERDAVVMEFIPGRTLADEVYECDPSVELAVRLFPQVCEAVRELHERFNPPLIHRDIKPSNFMVSGSSVFIIDLGIARTFDADASTDTSHFGTRAYAPPEQFGYGQTDVRSDVYALGMLLFYLLCEETPVIGQVEETLIAHDVPPALRNVVSQAASFDPADRLQSVAELEAAFESAIGLAGERCSVDLGPSVEQVPSAASRAEAVRKAMRSRLHSLAASTASLRKNRVGASSIASGNRVLTTPDNGGSGTVIETKFPWVQRILATLRDTVLRIPVGIGIAWDIIVALWLVLFAVVCVNSMFHPAGDAALLPVWARVATYSLTWLMLSCPVVLVLDYRPFQSFAFRRGIPRFRARLIFSVMVFFASGIAITLIGNVLVPAP